MANLTKKEATNEILKSVHQLFTSGVMSHSGHANISARLDENSFLITKTGMVRDLTENDFAVVNMTGEILEGTLDPTNLEIVDMHSIIYRLRPNAEAVIHTHSPSVLAFALANEPIKCRYEALLRFGQAADIPVAPWGPRGSKQSIDAIQSTISDNPNTLALILANHGLLAFSSSALATSGLIAAIEEAAEAELSSTQIGGAIDFPKGALEMVRESMAKARKS